MPSLADQIAPLISRHPGIWDLTRRFRGGAAAEVVTERRVRPFDAIDLRAGDLGPGGVFGSLADVEYTEGLYASPRGSVLLPHDGYVVAPHLVLEERGVIDFELQRRFRPGLRRYAAWRALDVGRGRGLDLALSFRTKSEKNHFHLVNDLIGGRLRMAHDAGVPDDTPIVVSSGLARLAVFGEIQQLPGLRDRRWIVQGPRELLRCRRLLVGQTGAASRENIEHARKVLGVEASDPRSADRIFVSRSAGRTIANAEEIAGVCREFGFTVVDPAAMSLAEQRAVFSRAGYVIGVHGAALTNLVFRRGAPLHVLEIFPNASGARGRYHFFFLCRVSGFRYHSLTAGSPDDGYPWDAPFELDARALADAIESLLAPDPDEPITGR